MAEVILFHHALGLTDWVRGLAARLGGAGHTVHTPDLYGGRKFETIPDGMAYSEDVLPAQSLEHDEQAAALLEERVLAFLRRC